LGECLQAALLILIEVGTGTGNEDDAKIDIMHNPQNSLDQTNDRGTAEIDQGELSLFYLRQVLCNRSYSQS